MRTTGSLTRRDSSQEYVDENDNASAMSIDTADDTVKDGKAEAASRRDEKAEIRKMARRDTRLLRTWRFVVAITLLAVGAAVSASTFLLLNEEEKSKFDQAVRSMTELPRNNRYKANLT